MIFSTTYSLTLTGSSPTLTQPTPARFLSRSSPSEISISTPSFTHPSAQGVHATKLSKTRILEPNSPKCPSSQTSAGSTPPWLVSLPSSKSSDTLCSPTPFSVFPELRTQLRTYHPVPPLQKTDGNLQDAPRIKNILKDCFLPSEGKGAPSPSPTEILSRLVCPREIRAIPAHTCRSLAAHYSLPRIKVNHPQQLS